jgi:hypothetical protein
MFAATALTAGSAAASVQRFGSRILTGGMRGADVRTLQQDLTLAGFTTRVSGVFDKTTQKHVVAFQRRYHLSPDGVVGPATARRVRSVDAAKARQAAAAATGAVGVVGSAPSSAPSTATSTTSADAASVNSNTGGASFAPGPPNAPVQKATLNSQGLAVAPQGAPEVIREVIAAANQIAFKPYVYGGGHQSFNSSGYDCSGSVSYALHGGGLLSSPFDSTQFETYGTAGAGRWMTIWANGGHAYMYIAGLRFDTAAQSSTNGNDRWTTTTRSNSGFTAVHPSGW